MAWRTSSAVSVCGSTMPEAPASSTEASMVGSFFVTRTMTWALPSEWCWMAWMALKASRRSNMPCSRSSQTKSGRVDASSLDTNDDGMPCAAPKSVFFGSALASSSAWRRLLGYVSSAAR
jgi:hypothetical protein